MPSDTPTPDWPPEGVGRTIEGRSGWTARHRNPEIGLVVHDIVAGDRKPGPFKLLLALERPPTVRMLPLKDAADPAAWLPGITDEEAVLAVAALNRYRYVTGSGACAPQPRQGPRIDPGHELRAQKLPFGKAKI